MYCLFSPDLTKHLDIDPQEQSWVIREARNNDRVICQIPNTLLACDPDMTEKTTQQARFITWRDNDEISLIDIEGDPFIEKVIKIPLEYTKDQPLNSKASVTVPFLDISPYKVGHSDERQLGTSNFFKAKLQLKHSDVHSRLKRMH